MTKFKSGDKVTHNRYGNGRVISVYAVATTVDEETEYTVKLVGERYPVTLSEQNLSAR